MGTMCVVLYSKKTGMNLGVKCQALQFIIKMYSLICMYKMYHSILKDLISINVPKEQLRVNLHLHQCKHHSCNGPLMMLKMRQLLRCLLDHQNHQETFQIPFQPMTLSKTDSLSFYLTREFASEPSFSTIGSKERCHLSYVNGISKITQWNLCHKCFFNLVRHNISHGGFDKSREYHINSDVELSKFFGCCLGETNDSCFAGSIVCLTNVASPCHHTGNIYNGP